MQLSITHKTLYRFEPPMRGVIQSHRLEPSRFDGQRVISWEVRVDGAETGSEFRDGAGDLLRTVSLLGPIEEVIVAVSGQVETIDLAGVLRGHRERVPPEAYLQSTRHTRVDSALRGIAEAVATAIPPAATLDRAHAVMGAVNSAIEYRPGDTGTVTTAAEAVEIGHGVCQDHAHAMIACAHALDLPARYVTGYLFTEAADEHPEASHAWAEVYAAGLGWVGFDAANNCCPDERYVRLGSGLDAAAAAPIRGVAAGAGVEALDVAVAVRHAGQ